MFEENELVRLRSIHKKLTDITTIVARHGSVTAALQDVEGQPAVLMLFVAAAEQFNKLKKQESKLLEIFQDSDLRGIADTRTFIAHDYDGVNLSLIEIAIRNRIPVLLETIEGFLAKH
ncbi:MAG: DUF86 domain-containing protein [Campylobacterales bacterium]|nr:DUF86 domain-containing protein [Campylobacterales bacterium]